MPYIGTQPNDVKENTGVYTPSEILQLTKDGHWSGSYELIVTRSADNSAQTLEFDNCFTTKYGMYLIHWKDFVPANDENAIYFRFKNASGEVTSGYQYANFRNNASGGSGEEKSTSAGFIKVHGGGGTGTNESQQGHIFVYAPAGSDRTMASYSSTFVDQNALYNHEMGGGNSGTAEATPGFMFRSIASGGTLGNINSLDVSVYGVKSL